MDDRSERMRNGEWMLMHRRIAAMALLCLCGACSVEDARTASMARKTLLGMTDAELETCLGAADQHRSFGNSEILTWYSGSTSSSGVSLPMPIPMLGGVSLSGGGGGYCHATAKLVDGRVTEVRYTGETNAPLARDAYCAPIVRSCVQHPEPRTGTAATPPATAPAESNAEPKQRANR
jgi:hypothetical protein